jgi:hypothetical protein
MKDGPHVMSVSPLYKTLASGMIAACRPLPCTESLGSADSKLVSMTRRLALFFLNEQLSLFFWSHRAIHRALCSPVEHLFAAFLSKRGDDVATMQLCFSPSVWPAFWTRHVIVLGWPTPADQRLSVISYWFVLTVFAHSLVTSLVRLLNLLASTDNLARPVYVSDCLEGLA